MSSRYAILEASEKFTHEQKSRRITPQDIFLATFDFGYPLTAQLKEDYYAGFKAWDSFSMILQSQELLPGEKDVERFKVWALWRLEII